MVIKVIKVITVEHLVDLDGRVDGPHEPVAREEAERAGDEEEEHREDEHVGKVDERRHEADDVELREKVPVKRTPRGGEGGRPKDGMRERVRVERGGAARARHMIE
eukprot:2740261-Prymnesium_polylepis.2